MKTIGLIGGMSWESSALYYKLINEETKKRLGGHHNARSVMVTVDFAEVERLQHKDDWDRLASLLSDAARQVERGGGDFIVLCTNTMHKVAGAITGSVRIPLLHIVDATAAPILRAGERCVGLLGTRFTMEERFYPDRMKTIFGIDTVVPGEASRELVHSVIYQELCHGVIRQESRERFLEIIEELSAQGAESIILGCTEIELLISQQHSKLPLYPSTMLHALAAVDLALSENG